MSSKRKLLSHPNQSQRIQNTSHGQEQHENEGKSEAKTTSQAQTTVHVKSLDEEKLISDTKIVDDHIDQADKTENDEKTLISEMKLVYEKGIDDFDDYATLSRKNPLSEFLKENKGMLKGLTEDEFKQRFDAFVKEREAKTSKTKSASPKNEIIVDIDSMRDKLLRGTHEQDFLTKIVLKFTTLSEANSEAASFTVDQKGARIGRDNCNEVCVPSDSRLADIAHSKIEFDNGSFYLVDCLYDFAASVRISVGVKKKEWVLFENAQFSVGNSIFKSCGLNKDGYLMLEVLEGPLKGERRIVMKKGASLGRSSDNSLSIPDRELSRHHSRIEYDDTSGQYFVCDIGSTNGTYIQLVGPYGGRYKLNLNDHILVGRTGFSINRYDFGLSEEMGHRQSMEDACNFTQNLDVPNLNVHGLAPQSFFGVFDGHGGPNASIYLSQHLHINIGEELHVRSSQLVTLVQSPASNIDYDSIDEIVCSALVEAFLKTDKTFILTSEYANNGSTATTALILGNRLYVANVGDSRTMIARQFEAKPMTKDHKPNREDEHKRILDAGGFVINNRVMGELAVSRAFGDSEFKKGIQNILDEEGMKISPRSLEKDRNTEDVIKRNWDQPLITAKPEIEVTTLTENDQFLLLACDGLFDVFTEAEIVDFVRKQMKEHGDCQKCCENLTDAAINIRNSRDNVSVILIILNKWY